MIVVGRVQDSLTSGAIARRQPPAQFLVGDVAADIPFGEQGRRVLIAGRPARLPVGPWSIALRAKATVIPAFIYRESPGHYRGVIHEAIKPPPGTAKQQVVKIQEIYRGHLEHYLKTYPEQWGNLQPFWDAP